MANTNKNTSGKTNDKEVQTVPFDKSKIKTLKRVTLPLLKQEDEKEYYVKFTSKFYLGKDIDGNSAGDNQEGKKNPPHLAQIINLETGREMELIANAVLKKNIEEVYPDDSYVGKCFEIVRHNIQGKNYKGYDIAEIADPSNE